jgi:hypothetical protein
MQVHSRRIPQQPETDHHPINDLMTRKKKWLILGATGIVLLALAVFLGLRYLPWHKLMKRPTSGDMAFISQQQGPGSAPFSLSFDFEVDPKAGIPDDIYQGIAHSGNYSTKTFGKNTFSVMFEKTIRDLNVRDLKAVALSAWVYVFPSSAEPEGSLVFTITNTVGVNTCWKGVSLHGPFVPREKWFKISGSFNLSDIQVRPDDKVQIYFWNNSDTKILSDDFYVVFGSQAPRRGDSAMVDMTRGDYTPGMNIPPFRVFLMSPEKTVNGNESGLDITPNDRIVTGRFLGAQGGLESIFLIKPDGTTELFHYCAEAGFKTFTVECQGSLRNVISAAEPLAGSFTGPGTDQLLFAGKNGIVLAGFNNTASLCGQAGSVVSLKEIWHSDGPGINGTGYLRPEGVIPCDVNGDGTTELLLISEQGSWELFKYGKDGWISLAKGTENRIGEWDDKYYDYTISTGPFLKGSPQSQILTVFSEKGKSRYNYSLVRYNAAEQKFVKGLQGREGNTGLTVGHDTLKPGDRFFFGQFRDGSKTILRYNRDWRFDLKELQFNDSTFVILGDVDFTGYENDQNPKFYEVLKLVPGRIVSPSVTSVMVIARNCKDRNYKGGLCKEWENLPYLPNSLRIYSFKTQKEK